MLASSYSSTCKLFSPVQSPYCVFSNGWFSFYRADSNEDGRITRDEVQEVKTNGEKLAAFTAFRFMTLLFFHCS